MSKSAESDHAANAVLRVHEVEAAVDLVERDRVGDERVDVDVSGEVAVDVLRNLVAPFHTSERRAGDATAGDEEAGNDVQGLPLAGDAAHRRKAPAHARG